ncbi:MAG: UvrD-helicase domain-containing protein [Collinsella sp.]
MRHGIRPFNRIIKDRFASNGLLPYSGMISLAIELLADFPKLRSYCRRRTLSFLVDEAQDTNALCYIFLNGLLSDESGICMFGDPIQRVHGFIGAMEASKTRATTDCVYRSWSSNIIIGFLGDLLSGARCCDSLQHEGCHCRRYAPTSHICWRCTARRSDCHRFKGRHSRSRR